MLKKDVLLSNHCSYAIGGPAKYFFEVKDIGGLTEAIKKSQELDASVFILGGGTNILFSDNAFNRFVIKIGFNHIKKTSEQLVVGAGIQMSDLLNYCAANGLSGLEWAGGLPGTLGGAIRGNAGAFGGEIKDIVEEVVSVDTNKSNQLKGRYNSSCDFSYRSSVFKKQGDQEIIIEARLNLKSGNPADIKKAIDEKINYRLERHPMEYPNVGSVFKNVDAKFIPSPHLEAVKHVVKQDPFPVVPTAFLLSEAGLKGTQSGGAMISPKHPNFIVNFSQARSGDIKSLLALAKERVYDRFQVNLEEEILIIDS